MTQFKKPKSPMCWKGKMSRDEAGEGKELDHVGFPT